MPLVVDVSSYQSIVDWQAVAGAKVTGALVKATEGVSYRNPSCWRQGSGARTAGLAVGFYHYARPDHNSATVEATYFCDAIGGVAWSIRPALDFEVWATRLTSHQREAWIRDFNGAVKARLGVWPIFYSYRNLIERLALERTVGNGLWLADYGVDDGKRHPVDAPAPWRKIALHQYTSRASVPGIQGRCDLSWARTLRPLLAPAL